jgi:lipoprotein-anchoring transpeptidase ErfK/SrfK
MASKFSDQAIVRAKGQVAYNAVSPEQRKIVSYMRQHPDATLAEARRGGPLYSKDELAKMAAETPWEDLTPYQKRLMKGIPDKPITDADIARHSGIPLSIVTTRINMRRYGGVNPSTLVFKASRGFYGKTMDGKQVIFYTVRSKRDAIDRAEFIAAFGTPQSIEKAVRERMPCPSPPCNDEDDAIVTIPLMNGAERENLPESPKGIKG